MTFYSQFTLFPTNIISPVSLAPHRKKAIPAFPFSGHQMSLLQILPIHRFFNDCMHHIIHRLFFFSSHFFLQVICKERPQPSISSATCVCLRRLEHPSVKLTLTCSEGEITLSGLLPRVLANARNYYADLGKAKVYSTTDAVINALSCLQFRDISDGLRNLKYLARVTVMATVLSTVIGTATQQVLVNVTTRNAALQCFCSANFTIFWLPVN